MAIAGRVAIVPKGDWSADATYKRLDAVTHNNTLYFAKKDVPAGTETSNTEYWSKSVVGGEATVDDTISSTSTNPVQNKVVKAYVDKKASENVDFSTSTSKLLNDSIEAQLVLSNATRNLLNPTLQTTTQNGVTCTNNGDGTYTLNGTASDKVNLIIYNENLSNVNIDLKKGVTYRAIGCPSGGSIETYSIMFNFWDDPSAYDTGDGANKQFDSSKTGLRLDISIKSGTVCNNLVLKPMLTTDLNATYDDFVPYSGYDIKTCGKNLFNGKYIKELISIGTDYTNRNLYDEFSSVNDITGLEYVMLGGYFRKGKYTLSYSNDAWFSFNRVAIAGTACIALAKTIRKTYTWEQTQDGYTYFSIEADDSETGTTDVPFSITPDIQIEEGTQATDYEQYKDGGTVHIDSSTEFPLLGLKSLDGDTNIISPGNVEVTYAKSDSGKAILDMSANKLDKDNVVNNQTTTEEGFALDARQANPNLDGTLAKQISDLNGSLEKLNDFTDISSNDDLNDIKFFNVGKYRCSFNDVAATVLNSPFNTAFTMEAFQSAGTPQYIAQKAIEYEFGHCKWRMREMKEGTIVQDWVQLY